MKKCPPGLICINNYIIGIIIIAIMIFIFTYGHFNQTIILNNHPSDKTVINNEPTNSSTNGWFNNGWFNNGWFNNGLIPSYPYTNDVLLNPYTPPLRDERVLRQSSLGRMVPINIATNVGASNTNYRQVGFLTPQTRGANDTDKLIPLMGRPLYTNRNKWQYYTMSDQRNSIKLPLLRSGRSCMNEYGCDGLYSGEQVNVSGHASHYTVTLYDADPITYLPFIS
jgi:hypothetical protein